MLLELLVKTHLKTAKVTCFRIPKDVGSRETQYSNLGCLRMN